MQVQRLLPGWPRALLLLRLLLRAPLLLAPCLALALLLVLPEPPQLVLPLRRLQLQPLPPAPAAAPGQRNRCAVRCGGRRLGSLDQCS